MRVMAFGIDALGVIYQHRAGFKARLSQGMKRAGSYLVPLRIVLVWNLNAIICKGVANADEHLGTRIEASRQVLFFDYLFIA